MPTLAQRLRKNPTVAEVRFWRLIDPLRRNGHHFRKQVAIGPYIVDFACHRHRVVVEIDGDTHYTEDGLAKDRIRDAYLHKRGFMVLRFTNDDVMTNPEGVYSVLASALAERVPPPLIPPLKGEGVD